jgi:hypothetical protein
MTAKVIPFPVKRTKAATQKVALEQHEIAQSRYWSDGMDTLAPVVKKPEFDRGLREILGVKEWGDRALLTRRLISLKTSQAPKEDEVL